MSEETLAEQIMKLLEEHDEQNHGMDLNGFIREVLRVTPSPRLVLQTLQGLEARGTVELKNNKLFRCFVSA